MTTEASKRFSLNSTDWLKIWRGALISLAGALIVFLTDLTTNYDFGDLTPLVTAISIILVNVLRKWISDNTGKEEKKDDNA